MPQHRHLLTLQFLVDIDEDALHRAAPTHDPERDHLERAFSDAVLRDPTAQWALLAHLLGPLAAAEAREALPGALDVTGQVAAEVFAHVGAPTDLIAAFEDAVATGSLDAGDGSLDGPLPALAHALRVLLIKAELLRVVPPDSAAPPP